MTIHNHYIGGKGKKAVERPPKSYVVDPVIICACKRAHRIAGMNVNTSQVFIACDCGASLCYRVGIGTTIERVVPDDDTLY